VGWLGWLGDSKAACPIAQAAPRTAADTRHAPQVAELRQLGVTLHLRLHSDRERVPDVPAIYFVRPTAENIERIVADSAAGLYERVYLNFSTQLSRELLELVGPGSPCSPCSPHSRPCAHRPAAASLHSSPRRVWSSTVWSASPKCSTSTRLFWRRSPGWCHWYGWVCCIRHVLEEEGRALATGPPHKRCARMCVCVCARARVCVFARPGPPRLVPGVASARERSRHHGM
jgi:hypothetical protein